MGDPAGTSSALVLESAGKAQGWGSTAGPLLRCKYPTRLPLERRPRTWRQWSERAGAQTRLPSGKVTATKCAPSCAGTHTFTGPSGRQHQLSSRGERRGYQPRGLERAQGLAPGEWLCSGSTECWGRCGPTAPRARRHKPSSAVRALAEPSRAGAACRARWPVCARAPGSGSPRLSKPGFQGHHFPLSLGSESSL